MADNLSKPMNGKDDVELALRRVKLMTDRLEASRETSMVITKLDEALMWLAYTNPKEYGR